MESYKNRLENRLKDSIDAFNNATMPFLDSLEDSLDDMLKQADKEVSEDDINSIKDLLKNPDIKNALDIINNQIKK